MSGENQSVEEPTVAEPTQTAPAEDFDAQVLSKMKELGVESVAQLDGMARASSESGNLARILGEVRKENAEMKQMLSQGMKNVDDGYDQSGDSVDLGGLIDQRLHNFARQQATAQTEANARYYADLASIQGDPEYGAVRPIWEQYLAQPAIQQKIQTGQSTMKSEYDKLARTYLRESLKKTSGQTQTLMDRQVVSPPHMESSDTQTVPIPSTNETQRQTIKSMTKPENWQGTNEDVESLVKTLLPADDPFFK